MDEATLEALLEQVRSGQVKVEAAVERLRDLPFSDIGESKVDTHRELRTGQPEAVFGPGKTPAQVAAICDELMSKTTGAVIVTRAGAEQYERVMATQPQAVFHEDARIIVVRASQQVHDGVVLVASAGTADQPVAEEACITLEASGHKVERLRDVGVAGLHRILASREAIARADVIVVVAGMDGALASIVGGLASVPVVAVPTSVGYGAGEGGIAPMLTMLNTCAPGVAVVNIDNGYGAAIFAATILRSRR